MSELNRQTLITAGHHHATLIAVEGEYHPRIEGAPPTLRFQYMIDTGEDRTRRAVAERILTFDGKPSMRNIEAIRDFGYASRFPLDRVRLFDGFPHLHDVALMEADYQKVLHDATKAEFYFRSEIEITHDFKIEVPGKSKYRTTKDRGEYEQARANGKRTAVYTKVGYHFRAPYIEADIRPEVRVRAPRQAPEPVAIVSPLGKNDYSPF